VQADYALVEALSEHAEHLILSPVETSLEISARVTQADVMVIDASQQPQRAWETIRQLTYDRPVLALVATGQGAEALRAGARGAVSRQARPSQIAAAITAVHEGLSVIDRPTLDALSVAAPRPTPQRAPAVGTTAPASDVLTKREAEVLVHLADGLSNKQIAAKLGISEHTAKFHVNSILQKMNAQKRVEAVVRAAKLGLIEI
jgi:DNA-binding NarL/FixJ family response regulator